MPRQSVRVPKYRHHKPSGRAVVTLDGRDVYLGKYGTPESKAEYNRIVGEWQLSCFQSGPTQTARESLTIDELIAGYLRHAEQYYIKDGRPTSSHEEITRSLRPLHELYSATPVAEFGPLALKALRQHMVHRGTWCRTTINRAIDIVKRMFKWAAENELILADYHHRLRTVSGLRKGRSYTREPHPVRPVPDEHVDAVIRHVSTPVAGMIILQRLTGMRPEEVVSMRLCDLDRSSKA